MNGFHPDTQTKRLCLLGPFKILAIMCFLDTQLCTLQFCASFTVWYSAHAVYDLCYSPIDGLTRCQDRSAIMEAGSIQLAFTPIPHAPNYLLCITPFSNSKFGYINFCSMLVYPKPNPQPGGSWCYFVWTLSHRQFWHD